MVRNAFWSASFGPTQEVLRHSRRYDLPRRKILRCKPAGRWGSSKPPCTSLNPVQRLCRAYGDADPSNVSFRLSKELKCALALKLERRQPRSAQGLRGIGICSVEEIGSILERQAGSSPQSKKLPPRPTNGNYGGRTVRDHLCQLIRQHQLDATLVKSYATDFCGVKSIREATREQVENFVAHLADWAEKNRDGLLCQLNSYLGQKEGAA